MIRVVIADHEPLVREGIARILERSGVAVVDIACDTADLPALVDLHVPDVVVTELGTARRTPDGLDAVAALRSRHPALGVLVLSRILDEDHALALIGDRADGVGYLLKDHVVTADVVSDAVHRVAAGGAVLDPDVIARLAGQSRRGLAQYALTPREYDVLDLMARGLSNAGIARKLAVSRAAVERHVTHLFLKLDLHQDDSDKHRRVLAVLTILDGSSGRPAPG